MEIKTLGQKDFDWTRWSEKEIKEKTNETIELRKESFSNIKKIKKENRNFENTIFALEKSNRKINSFSGYLDVLSQTHSKKNIRESAQKFQKFLCSKMIEIDFDKEVYQAILEYKNKSKKEKLDDSDKILLKEFFESYRDMGFFLSQKKQEELRSMDKRILKLSLDFSININNYKGHILLSKGETGGLSKIFLESLKKEGGKFVISLDYPEMIPFMETSSCEKKRKELSIKFSKKGGKKNLKLLNEILLLKKKKVSILGFKSYPDYISRDRMAKKGKNIEKFFSPLLEQLKKPGADDLKILEELKKKKTGNSKAKIHSYDIAYYSNILKQEKFNINKEEIKEFFQLEKVKKEMMEMFGNLFDFEIKINKSIKLWDKDVKFYDIFQKGKKISHIIFDLFPREGKYGHAAMWDIENFSKDNFDRKDGNFSSAAALVVCNFPKPTNKIPSLISHNDMTTLFHEFGHALHHTLTKAKYFNNSGTNVSVDFVETPSQLLENWAWNETFLYKVSEHWKTKKKIEKKKIRQLISSKSSLSSYMNLRQLCMTKLDYDLHSKNIKNPEVLWKKISKQYMGISPHSESLFPSSFCHIVGGYDSGYYSYLWSLVYSDDIFSEFIKKGIFNKQTGKRYLKEILEVGSERDEKKSVENFLKRKSNAKAFLKKLRIS